MIKMKNFADSHIHIRGINYEKIAAMLDDIASEGVTHVSLLALPYRSVAEDVAALYTKMKYKKMFVRVFGGLHYNDAYADVPYEKQVEALLEMGCDGIKIMCSPILRKFLNTGLNDPKYEKMFASLEERRTPINIHLADPETFWGPGERYHESYPSYKQHYDEIFEVLDSHPKLNVVFAHFFFLSDSPDEAVRVMEKYPNVYFDLTPGTEMYDNFTKRIEFWHDFFKKYSHRILFGTDSNTCKSGNVKLNRLVYRTLTNDHNFFTENCYGRDFIIRGLDLPDEVVERICYRNYIDFVGSEVKAVNVDLWRSCCKKILEDVDGKTIDEYYEASWKDISGLAEDPYQKIAIDFCTAALADYQ